MRQYLTEDKTCFISPSGSDANDGLSAPWQTPQHAFDVICNTLDFGGRNVVLQFVDGVYPQGAAINAPVVGAGSSGGLTLQGNVANPDHVIWGVAAANSTTLSVANGANVTVRGFQLQASPTSQIINLSNHAVMNLSDYNIGVGQLAFNVNFFAILNAIGNCKIACGSTNAFAHINRHGYLNMVGGVATLIGNPHFADFFLGTSENSECVFENFTFSGPATGRRAFIHQGATVISSSNAFDLNTFFPGDVDATLCGKGSYNDFFGTVLSKA